MKKISQQDLVTSSVIVSGLIFFASCFIFSFIGDAKSSALGAVTFATIHASFLFWTVAYIAFSLNLAEQKKLYLLFGLNLLPLLSPLLFVVLFLVVS